MITFSKFETRIARIALFAAIAPLLIACHDNPVGNCGHYLRTTAFNAAVPLSEVGQSTMRTLGPHVSIEESRTTGFETPQASLHWSTDSGIVLAGVTGSLDTIGASGPLFIAGKGRITLRNSAGVTGQGSLKRVYGDGEFHMACID